LSGGAWDDGILKSVHPERQDRLAPGNHSVWVWPSLPKY